MRYRRQMPAIQRILRRLLFSENGCWIFGEGRVRGYGHVSVGGRNGRRLMAHRIVYEHYRGPIPEGLVLDHLCRIPSCVKPGHLRPVTHKENLQAPNSLSRSRLWADKTHCVHGHPFSPENTYQRRPTGGRACKACWRERRRYRRRGEANQLWKAPK